MCQQVGRITVNAIRPGTRELIFSVAATKQSDAARSRALCRQQVPHAIPDHDTMDRLYSKALRAVVRKRSGLGFAFVDLFSSDYRISSPMPSIFSDPLAFSRLLLVPIAYGTLSFVSMRSNSFRTGKHAHVLETGLERLVVKLL